jgi:hypothetical protein
MTFPPSSRPSYLTICECLFTHPNVSVLILSGVPIILILHGRTPWAPHDAQVLVDRNVLPRPALGLQASCARDSQTGEIASMKMVWTPARGTMDRIWCGGVRLRRG